MARNETRRQKSLMKKKRKNKERKKGLFNGFSDHLYRRKLIKEAKEFPIYECLINPDWREQGIAQILFSRGQPNNKLIVGVFLVDIYCLGLKNTFCNADISLEDYESRLKSKISQGSSLITCHPCLANRIIYGAIEYAKRLGFEPQRDFALSRSVLNEPSDADLTFEVEFGKDGKPLYISGPDDNVDYVMKKLMKNVGEGNFNFINKI